MDEGIAVLGGTGPLGLGLALRFATAGLTVRLGSRSPSRAVAAAECVRAAVPGARVEGLLNQAAAASAPRVALCVPFAALPPLLEEVGAMLARRLVLDTVVPVAFERGFCTLAPAPGAPSAGEWIQAHLADSRVVSAFKNVAAAHLQNLERPLHADVLLCGEDEAARNEVSELVARIPGLRPIDAGQLANTRYLEGLTALLINLNRRHQAEGGVLLTGIPR